MKIELSLRYWLFILLSIVFLLYVLFQTRFIILGPRISILSHSDGFVSSSPNITIRGKATNIAWISLNGRQIFINEKGFWEETLLLAQGVSIMSIEARDRFGRKTTKNLRIIYQ